MTGQSTELSAFNEGLFSNRKFEARESRLTKALNMLDAQPFRGRALDVAAGSGIAAEVLTRQGWTVTALDISTDLLAQVRARGIDDAHQHDLASGPLPFGDGTFHAVFAGEIIEHLVDTTGFLSEVRRVLCPGGVVVITTPNLTSLENRLRMLFGRYPLWVDHELAGEGHVRAYTFPVLRRQLQGTGFAVEELKGNFVPLLPQRYVNDLTVPALARSGDWLPRLSQGLVVLARASG